MLDFPLDLRRAAGIVRTIKGCFAFTADQRGFTFRATGDEFNGLCHGVPLFRIHPYDFGDDFTPFFNQDRVPFMQVKSGNNIGIMQRSPFNACPGQPDRFQIGYGCYRACAAYLVINGLQYRGCLFCFELIGYCPFRRFSGKTQ